MAAPIVAVAKKSLEILASSNKGRKFLGLTIGITLFLILLPLIVLYAFFSGIADNGYSIWLQTDQIIASLTFEQQEQLTEIDAAYQRIAEVFSEKGMPENDIQQAREIYIGLLIGKEKNEDFFNNLSWCFENVSEESSLYDNIADKFSITLTDEEIAYFDEKYGVIINETEEDK